MSEFRFDARQSRLTLLAEGKVGSVKALGEYEVYFLGAAPTAKRAREELQPEAAAVVGLDRIAGGLTLTGGKQRSSSTLKRKGIANRTEFLPLTIMRKTLSETTGRGRLACVW